MTSPIAYAPRFVSLLAWLLAFQARPALADEGIAAEGTTVTAAAPAEAVPADLAPAAGGADSPAAPPSAVPPAIAAPASEAPKPVPLPAPSPAPALPPDWYEPRRVVDAELPWNKSIFGSFDPWTSKKVTLLATGESVAFVYAGTQGLAKITPPGGATGAKVDYPSVRSSGILVGGRLEWREWSLAVATGTVRLTLGDGSGTGGTLSGAANQLAIGYGFGAWAIHDFGKPDIRLGIAWPELALRVLYVGTGYRNAATGLEGLDFARLGAGVSLLGLRATITDVLFAEVRAGSLDADVFLTLASYAPTSPGGKSQGDVTVSTHASNRVDWTPSFRLGIAF